MIAHLQMRNPIPNRFDKASPLDSQFCGWRQGIEAPPEIDINEIDPYGMVTKTDFSGSGIVGWARLCHHLIDTAGLTDDYFDIHETLLQQN
jgi:hypothetical protein